MEPQAWTFLQLTRELPEGGSRAYTDIAHRCDTLRQQLEKTEQLLSVQRAEFRQAFITALEQIKTHWSDDEIGEAIARIR